MVIWGYIRRMSQPGPVQSEDSALRWVKGWCSLGWLAEYSNRSRKNTKAPTYVLLQRSMGVIVTEPSYIQTERVHPFQALIVKPSRAKDVLTGSHSFSDEASNSRGLLTNSVISENQTFSKVSLRFKSHCIVQRKLSSSPLWKWITNRLEKGQARVWVFLA